MQVSLADSSEAAQHGGRHAFLHDFCMVIPYSIIIAAAGLVTLVFGSRTAGVQLLLGGVVMGGAAFSSLRRWKRQLPSRLVTTFAAGAPSCSSRSGCGGAVHVLLEGRYFTACVIGFAIRPQASRRAFCGCSGPRRPRRQRLRRRTAWQP